MLAVTVCNIDASTYAYESMASGVGLCTSINRTTRMKPLVFIAFYFVTFVHAALCCFDGLCPYRWKKPWVGIRCVRIRCSVRIQLNLICG